MTQLSCGATCHSKNKPKTKAADSPTDLVFLSDVWRGLSLPAKELHCKYFYDRRGSQLFDQICELDEYYPTRTEARIMSDHAAAMASRVGSGAVVVEYGSGSSTKTRVLLNHLHDQRAYLPVDISKDHLMATAAGLQVDYPDLVIHPIVADFTADFDLPAEFDDSAITVYFPGSTIGNLEPPAAVSLLRSIGDHCHDGGGLLIGFDLDKSADVLVAAYDDAQGVTAEFNLNLLQRINRELDGDFCVDRFSHVAVYNAEHQRIEISIESLDDQTVTIAGRSFEFSAGERILTEYSHKYTIDGFAAMAAEAGLVRDEVWVDDNQLFAVMHLSGR